MARKTLPLTDTEVRNAKPKAKQYKLFDGRGLFLLVSPNGSKGWRLKYRYASKEKLLSLGPYPGLSLADARLKLSELRASLADGKDPSQVRKVKNQQKRDRQEQTFQWLAKEWFGKKTANLAESTRDMTKRRLEIDVFPAIGVIPVLDITPQMVLEGVLRPMEKRGAVELAHRTKSIVSRVLRFGVACGYVERDVTADLRGALESFERKHYPALTDPKQVGGLLRAMDDFEGSFVVQAALRLHPLVVVRPGELRHMEWSEVDLHEGVWNIPADKMKMKTPHIVPLSWQAIAILQQIQPLTGIGVFVFPSLRSAAKPISNNTLNAALRRLGYSSGEVTSHGWRATFRTLADEVLRIRPDFIEHQLAHVVKDPNGRAYNRTAHLEERKKMMQAWADYLDGLKLGAKVIPFSYQTV